MAAFDAIELVVHRVAETIHGGGGEVEDVLAQGGPLFLDLLLGQSVVDQKFQLPQGRTQGKMAPTRAASGGSTSRKSAAAADRRAGKLQFPAVGEMLDVGIVAVVQPPHLADDLVQDGWPNCDARRTRSWPGPADTNRARPRSTSSRAPMLIAVAGASFSTIVTCKPSMGLACDGGSVRTCGDRRQLLPGRSSAN